MTFAEVLAIILIAVYLILVYYWIFKISKALYRRGTIWLIAFLIFLAPFGFALILVDSLVGLMWVLALTPFIGVAVLIIYFTNWMLLYYGLAYTSLAVVYWLLKGERAYQNSN